MSNPHLPPEIFDYMVDLLHDRPYTLRQCCLVSKSWVPRTQKHLLASVNFYSFGGLEAWRGVFPDPANSPAYHTRSLSISCPQFVTVADAEEGGWLRAFSHVVQLKVEGRHDSESSLVPFHNFSPVLKSLQVSSSLPRSQVFNLVCSLPLLEDLVLREFLVGEADYDGIEFRPLTSPPLTGTFELHSTNGSGPTVRRLLDLPGGFHFRKLVLKWLREKELQWIMALVVGCSDTLECLDIHCFMRAFLWFLPLDQ